MRRFVATFCFVFALLSTVVCHAEEIKLDRVLITLIQQVDVPSQEAGVLSSIKVREGVFVKAGQIVGQLEGKAAKNDLDRAEMQLKIRQHLAKSKIAIDLASKVVEQEKHSSKQQKFDSEIAQRLAKNRLKIQSANKGKEVAANELQRVLDARKKFAESVSDSEIDNKQLTVEQAKLESEQAVFENDIDGLKAKAQQEAALSHKLSVERSVLEVTQAEDEQATNQLQSQLQQLEVTKAQLNIKRREISSPIDGVVVELYKQKGEWVKPGESVIRILRLNRLRAEGFLPISKLKPSPIGAKVAIDVALGNGSTVRMTGKIVFVSPEVDSDNREVRIWAEFDNPKMQVLPGMHGSMTIDLNPPTKSSETKTVPKKS